MCLIIRVLEKARQGRAKESSEQEVRVVISERLAPKTALPSQDLQEESERAVVHFWRGALLTQGTGGHRPRLGREDLLCWGTFQSLV